MVCLGVTSAEEQDPGLVLYTHIELPLEQEASGTACPVLLVRTVTAQVWHSPSHLLAFNSNLSQIFEISIYIYARIDRIVSFCYVRIRSIVIVV